MLIISNAHQLKHVLRNSVLTKRPDTQHIHISPIASYSAGRTRKCESYSTH